MFSSKLLRNPAAFVRQGFLFKHKNLFAIDFIIRK